MFSRRHYLFMLLCLLSIFFCKSIYAQSPPKRTFHALTDRWSFRLPPNVYNTTAILRNSECNHCYIYVEENINNDVSDAEVKQLVDEFDNVVWPNETAYFGNPPNVDNDDKIYILILDIPIKGVNGYFWPDQEGWRGYFFDHIEILYLDFMNWSFHVLAHEFNHMIQYAYDSNEEIWMNEGFADYAAHTIYQGYTGHIEAFLETCRDTNLVENDEDVFYLDPVYPCYYGASYLFIRYLANRIDIGIDKLKDIFHDPDPGIQGIEKHFPPGMTFKSVFQDWVIANLLDSSEIDPKYNYADLDINGWLIPSETTFSSASGKVMIKDYSPVNEWSADYIKVRLEEDNLSVTSTFKGDKSSDLFAVLFDGKNLHWFDLGGSSKNKVSIQINTGNQRELIYIIGRKADSGKGTYQIELSASPPPTISVSLSAQPSTGEPPLDVKLKAKISGAATGSMDYYFWWDCNDAGTDVNSVTAACGDPLNPDYGARFDGVTSKSKTVTHRYSSCGAYTAKVVAEQQGVAAEYRAPINVTATNWLSFVEGNPGIPGDGQFVNGSFIENDRFTLSTPISLGQFKDGFTATIFPDIQVQQLMFNPGISTINYQQSDRCWFAFGSGMHSSGTTNFNSVKGFFVNVSQADIQDWVSWANQNRPGCNLTVNDLFIGGFVMWQWGTNIPITVLDAAVILPGQNVVP